MEFEEYVAARRAALVRSAVLLGCRQPDAEDVVQTALLRCYRSWRRVQRATQPDAYVYRVLVNWRPCPMTVSACPPTVQEMLAAHDGQIRISAGLPDTACVLDEQEPLAWVPDVTLSPRDTVSCQGWFAVQLDINDVGQITAANVILDWF